ncbi:MAG: hypothetical protein ACO1N0_19765 [Fluviicola sp.]
MKPSFITLILLLACGVCSSCKRIHKNHPEMVGSWFHRDEVKSRWFIQIDKTSWGTVTVYDSTGKDLEYNGENGRFWRYNERNGSLHNGIISPNFDINQFPKVADKQMIKKFDTIEPGETYCIINTSYYKKTD